MIYAVMMKIERKLKWKLIRAHHTRALMQISTISNCIKINQLTLQLVHQAWCLKGIPKVATSYSMPPVVIVFSEVFRAFQKQPRTDSFKNDCNLPSRANSKGRMGKNLTKKKQKLLKLLAKIRPKLPMHSQIHRYFYFASITRITQNSNGPTPSPTSIRRTAMFF